VEKNGDNFLDHGVVCTVYMYVVRLEASATVVPDGNSHNKTSWWIHDRIFYAHCRVHGVNL